MLRLLGALTLLLVAGLLAAFAVHDKPGVQIVNAAPPPAPRVAPVIAPSTAAPLVPVRQAPARTPENRAVDAAPKPQVEPLPGEPVVSQTNRNFLTRATNPPAVYSAFEAPKSSVAAPTKAGLDLNSASLDQLNRLGAGLVGKAIMRGRPYGSPEDLARKRVVTRATFDRMKDQVAVR